MLSASLASQYQVRRNSSSSSQGREHKDEQKLENSLEQVLHNLNRSLPAQPLDPESSTPATDDSQRALKQRRYPRLNEDHSDTPVDEARRPTIRTYSSKSGYRNGNKITPTEERVTGNKLTHVNQSGEAHMVDVGHKSMTRRIAIAQSVVSFSNLETLELIEKNENKKGDVLSVARLAGIMAAKRTPDLIPLCHPVNITKVDVHLRLMRPTHLRKEEILKTSHGSVIITATVECTGQTGVEMEALTAAMGSALTVYDMCKATDRDMMIHYGKLLYKSGGRSGLFVDSKWMRVMGEDYFTQRGLELPEDATFATRKSRIEKRLDLRPVGSQPDGLQSKPSQQKQVRVQESDSNELRLEEEFDPDASHLE